MAQIQMFEVTVKGTLNGQPETKRYVFTCDGMETARAEAKIRQDSPSDPDIVSDNITFLGDIPQQSH